MQIKLLIAGNQKSTPVPMGGQEKLHNHMAQGYIYQMQIWNVQIIVNYICFMTGINMIHLYDWHKHVTSASNTANGYRHRR